MDTRSIASTAPAIFDGAILHAVQMITGAQDQSSDDEITDTLRRVVVGVRNELGQVYRYIHTSTLREYINLSQAMRAMGFRDEGGAGQREGCDAIFSLDASRPGSRALLGADAPRHAA